MANQTSYRRFNGRVIPIRDFIYLVIIMLIFTVSIVSMTLADSSKAGENLNFAATLASIILAVLAIVITLVESVSQKENLRKLSDLSEAMDKSIERSQLLVTKTFEKSEEQVKTMINLKDELKDHYESSVKSLQENLYKYTEGSNTLDKEALDEIFKESMKEMNKKTGMNNKKENNSDIDTLAEYVYMNFDFNYPKTVSQKELKDFTIKGLEAIGFTHPIEKDIEAIKVLNRMCEKYDVFFVDGAYTDLPF